MQPIILISDETKSKQDCDEIYSLKTNDGKCAWPKRVGRGLGTAGMFNFIWRLGFHPKQLKLHELPESNSTSTLFIDKNDGMDHQTQIRLREWMACGGRIIATGELSTWKSFLPNLQWKTIFPENPYAACGYLFDRIYLVTPERWSFIQCDENNEVRDDFLGQMAIIQGERQTPERAQIVCQKNAPAVIQCGLFFYLNAHPFSALQAWTQGQEDISPWLSWRHRLFWLDEWISSIFEIMLNNNILSKNIPRKGISFVQKNTIILRHDLDYSRDTTYLSLENMKNISATHAVLKDNNTRFWVNKLKECSEQEIAFHYNTGKRNWSGIFNRFIRKKERLSFLPCYRQIAGNGLLKQLRWAKRNGIQIQTIHRHLAYLVYPEWIDAMDTIYENDQVVLGSSSLFQGHVLRWGFNQVEGNVSTNWPDVQFPIWYPIKLAHAGKDGKILRGWEVPAVMELDLYVLNQIIDHKVKHVLQNIFNIIYHPGHANKSTFYRQGSIDNFIDVLDFAREKNIRILPMNKILQYADQSFI